MDIPELLQSQRNFFDTQQTKNIAFRKSLLKKLLQEKCNCITYKIKLEDSLNPLYQIY